MRELLEKCKLFVSCASDFTREQRLDLLNEIKAELEKPEPEPEPVGEVDYFEYDNALHVTWTDYAYRFLKLGDKLYTNPPAQQKPLSDEEINNLKYFCIPSDLDASLRRFAREVEKAHGIK